MKGKKRTGMMGENRMRCLTGLFRGVSIRILLMAGLFVLFLLLPVGGFHGFSGKICQAAETKQAQSQVGDSAQSQVGDSAQPQVIKVGYVQMQGFLYQQKDGSYAGYAYELLQEIGVYNNWEYEFVSCGYAQTQKLLESGKIDIFIPYQKTPQRQAVYEYSNQIFCTNKASLLTLPETDIYFEDYEHMDGITIGSVRQTRNTKRFQAYLEAKGAHVTMKDDYINQSELIAAMNRGEIDAFISASNRGISDCKMIEVLSETNSYVIAKKGDRTYLDKIDQALEKININLPKFISALDEKYQVAEDGIYPALTRTEAEYIAKKKQVSVLVNSEECDRTGAFTGSAKVLLDRITEMTGLSFVPVVRTQTNQVMADFTAGEADMMYSFHRDYTWARMHNARLTDSYAEFFSKVVTKKKERDITTVAVVEGSYIEYYVTHVLKKETVPCASYKDGIDMVKAGKVDAVYCNSPIGNYYSTFPEYRSLSFLSAYDFQSAYCMAVSNSSDMELIGIMDKCISCIPETVLSAAFEEQVSSRPVSYTDILYSNPVLVVLVVLVFVGVVVTLIFTILLNRVTKRKNKQLAIANSAKTDFLARMSHDMRTPMNGILGLTQLSLEEQDPEELHRNLGQIELSGKYLLNLINDTLDMNRIESGKLELHLAPVNSEAIFSNVIANASILAKEKKVHLKLTIPPIAHGGWVPILADASRLEQILMNVISNAIKFTKENGEVELIMQTVSITDTYVEDCYMIKDTGIGMKKEFLPHIFEPFSQEGNMNLNREEGTGLGMPIVKQLVDLMGGTIAIESELDVGTVVTLHMKYQVYKGIFEKEQSGTTDYSALAGARILLCEDHPLNAEITRKLLEKQHIEMVHAENGRQGLELFTASKEGEYDLILMDIRMPEMNGIACAKAIRSLERTDAKTVPIIAMTANAFDDDVSNCLAAGMNAHLSKPIDAQKLYTTIATYLK